MLLLRIICFGETVFGFVRLIGEFLLDDCVMRILLIDQKGIAFTFRDYS